MKKLRVLVTGASKGIGRAICDSFLEIGADVVASSRSVTSSSLQYSSATCIDCDLSSLEEVKLFVKELETRDLMPDVLVNNQGGPATGTLAELSTEQWQEAFTMCVQAPLFLMQHCLPQMKRRGFGRIVNILSMTAREVEDNMLLSNTFRPALLGASKDIARMCAGSGVTVNSILPYVVETHRLESILERVAQDNQVPLERFIEQVRKDLPMARFTKPEEIAASVKYLCSTQAGYLTGISLPFDGGASRVIA